MLSADLLIKSRQAFLALPHQDKKNGYHLPRHLLGLALEGDASILCWIEREVSDLKHSPDKNISNWMDRAKFWLSQGIKLGDPNQKVLFPPLSVASQARYLLPQWTKSTNFSQFFPTTASSQKNGSLYSCKRCKKSRYYNYRFRQWNALQARKSLSGITIVQIYIAKDQLFLFLGYYKSYQGHKTFLTR